MYEVCSWRHITQYHPADASMATDWVISLGHYQGVEWAPTNASQTGVYSKVWRGAGRRGLSTAVHSGGRNGNGPNLCRAVEQLRPWRRPLTVPAPCMHRHPPLQGTTVPYVEQRSALGNICERDGVDAQGKRLEPVLRRTALRLMCSPSGEAHVVVSEPQQCVYRVELYVPSLCTVPGFEVTPVPGGAAGDWDEEEDDEDEVRAAFFVGFWFRVVLCLIQGCVQLQLKTAPTLKRRPAWRASAGRLC